MAVYPNARLMSCVAGRHFGGATAAVGGSGAGFDTVLRTQRGDRLGRFNGEEVIANASTPDGYGMQAWVGPRLAGGMAALGRIASATGSGNLLQGGPMEGGASLAFTPDDASLSMIVSMSGTASFTVSISAAALSMISAMSGAGSIAMTGSGALSMIVPFDGAGSFGFSGAGDLKGLLSMDGGWTPFSTLSPENLAQAVWGAIASSNNEAGTMGAKLNTASSGGVDMGALAQAVWEYGTRTLTGAVSGGLTVEQATQLLELHRIHGLEAGVPLVVTPSTRQAGGISQTIGTSGDTVTVSRA